MTNEEAIYCFNHPTEYCTSEREEAIKLAIEALERQVAKKPTNKDNCGNDGLYFERCPICFEIINDDNYCHNCGQKLDWN